MLRKLLLYLSQAGWARSLVTHFFLARRVARRFVAGETLNEAIATTQSLNAQGLLVSLDYLGENVTHETDTVAVVDMYRQLVARIGSAGLDASISLKLTHMGLDISEDLCMRNLRHILTDARVHNIPVTIDMESSDYTDVTLRIYRTLRDEYDFANVGTVIQSALRRSTDDMQALAEEGARVRLCKGAYLEPPSIAYPDKADVDAHYIRLLAVFLQHAPPAYLDIATHDEAMISAALESIQRYEVPRDSYEFQMLYGIRSSRQLELAAAGHTTRVYVPFGEAWYPYFMRRLAERPANLWFFMRSMFR
ncbi:MAG: proline dehydrogenase family protein [Chloroflexota bacterium]